MPAMRLIFLGRAHEEVTIGGKLWGGLGYKRRLDPEDMPRSRRKSMDEDIPTRSARQNVLQYQNRLSIMFTSKQNSSSHHSIFRHISCQPFIGSQR